MVGNVYTSHYSIRPIGLKDIRQLDEATTARLLNIQPLQQRNWLYSRHIEDKTIDPPEFKGQIVQRPFETQNGIQDQHGFPHAEHGAHCDAQYPDSSHNMLVFPQTLQCLVIQYRPGVKPREISSSPENPIDALSHYQLNLPRQPGDTDLVYPLGGSREGFRLPTPHNTPSIPLSPNDSSWPTIMTFPVYALIFSIWGP